MTIVLMANSKLINHYTTAADGIPIYLFPIPVFKSLETVDL